MLKFTILFDNYKYEQNLQNLWGFSCLIEIDGQTILFDTGSNGRVLLANAKKLGIDFKSIDVVFISHTHWDHMGGLDTVIEENPNIILILPESVSKHLLSDLEEMVKEVIIIDENFTKLSTILYSTGIMSKIKEQSLIIDYNGELFIISGCGHPEIDKIENRVLKFVKNKKVKYILGGFHLLDKKAPEIRETIGNIQTEFITATHCTGDTAIGMLKVLYKNRFLNGGVGAVIEF